MKNLIPKTVNSTNDYYCTWQAQLYASDNGGPVGQREHITEEDIFTLDRKSGKGFAYQHKDIRKDLLFVIDDGWDVPFDNDEKYYGSLILNKEKFPQAYAEAEKTGNSPLYCLAKRIEAIGWKGLGLWICAQESPVRDDCNDPEEYWINRLKESNEAGIRYWKLDWGKRCEDADFRNKLTLLAREYAPKLVIDQAKAHECIPTSDVFRSYDVPALMSIPRTFEKMGRLLRYTAKPGFDSVINCEDEAYLAAALGLSMGIMRHNMTGCFPCGTPDLSFPATHRDLKTKMTEIKRAVNFHKIAPAFAVDEKNTRISDEILEDGWQVEHYMAEVEDWWGYRNGDVLEGSGPAYITRNVDLCELEIGKSEIKPFFAASVNPSGAAAIATFGRTKARSYIQPDAKLTFGVKSADTVGIFGSYESLDIVFDYSLKGKKIYAQDLAGDNSVDITSLVNASENTLTLSGALIESLGTVENPEGDTSEAGLLIKIIGKNKAVKKCQ